MNELLGIALEFAAARRRLANRLSPLARRLAFPDLYERYVYKRKIVQPKIRKIGTDWSSERRVTKEDKAIAAQHDAERIVSICARHFDVPVGQVYDASRKAIYVRPRQAAAALMIDVLKLSFPVIGLILNRDHSSIIAALRTHAVRHATDAEYRRRFTAAEEEVKAAFRETPDAGRAAGDEVDGRAERPSHPLPANMREAA